MLLGEVKIDVEEVQISVKVMNKSKVLSKLDMKLCCSMILLMVVELEM